MEDSQQRENGNSDPLVLSVLSLISIFFHSLWAELINKNFDQKRLNFKQLIKLGYQQLVARFIKSNGMLRKLQLISCLKNFKPVQVQFQFSFTFFSLYLSLLLP
eukprot:TRINITY_DN139150_c1_g1_i1.p3 TRINITY_DN139150_c1_g1~~TRINITY_DN139150_c1_g1_i1.p3  ORF type:complete len:104 (+),score=1.64 TRINITY_DN139150_c1_g1_i1:3-314(+)